MISGENKTIGTSEHRHDLAALNEPLRSHGGLTEQAVPFITNRVLPDQPDAPALRNFDAFYYAVMAAAVVELGAFDPSPLWGAVDERTGTQVEFVRRGGRYLSRSSWTPHPGASRRPSPQGGG